METTPEQAAEGIVLVRVLAAVLERLVCTNETASLADPGQVTKFHALKAPGIGILQYLERIHKYASCSNECFVLALIYIDRLIRRNNFLLTELNVHRVVITAILLAAKFFDDAYYNNAYYAKVGGVLVSEMNGLEVDFLFRIHFSLHVTPELFHKYREELMSHSAISQPKPPLVQQQQCPAPVGHEHQHQLVTAGHAQQVPPIQVPQEMEASAGMHIQVQAHTNHNQQYQQQTAFPEELPKRHSTYITPSPPDTSGKNPSLHLSGTDVITGMPDVTVQAQQPSSNPLVMPSFPMVQSRRCSPQPAFAPPAMVPIVSDNSSMSTMSTTDDRYYVVDNIAYPLHGSVVTPVDVNGAPQHSHVYGSRPAAEVAYNPQYFVGGHMLAGCSGGD